MDSERFLYKRTTMENSRALQGIQQILSKLEEEELFGLAATVTQGLLKNKLRRRTGAIEAILKYSSDLQSILRRKVVTRDMLFTYSHENGLPVTLPALKNDLIDVICQYWDLKPTAFIPAPSKTVDHFYKCEAQPAEKSPSEINTLALKFTEWFYKMMNSHEPIGSEHFWNDAKLKLHLISASQAVNQNVDESAEEIAKVLYRTKCEHNLYFNPNFLSDGIQGRIDPHGLVVVLVCGTLHSNNTCVGVFEQIFMLTRDPFSDNNWKIKNTELNLKSKNNVSAPPSLCDSNLTSNLLALPQS